MLRPHKQQTFESKICPKLALGSYGPFDIIGMVGPVAYKLLLPLELHIHLVFHVGNYHSKVSLLKIGFGG